MGWALLHFFPWDRARIEEESLEADLLALLLLLVLLVRLLLRGAARHALAPDVVEEPGPGARSTLWRRGEVRLQTVSWHRKNSIEWVSDTVTF